MPSLISPASWRALGTCSLAVAVLAACSGGGSTAPSSMTRTIIVDGTQAGYMRSSLPSYPSVAFASNPIVGDQDLSVTPARGYRGVVGFSLASLPSGLHVTLATLTITPCSVVGTPLAKLGTMVVDHVSFGIPFDTTSYAGGTLTSDIGAIITDVTAGKKTLDVTSSVVSDVAASRLNSQFRLRMANLDTNNDGQNDYYVIATDAAHSDFCTFDANLESTLSVTFTQ